MTQDNATDADSDIAIAIAQPNGNPSPLPDGLTAADLVEVCRQLILVRTMDERIWMMNRQGKVPIAASSQGHEAAEMGSLLAAQKDGDCFLFPYYRDLALKMSAGLTPRQVMLSFMGKDGEPYSGARQFPLARRRPAPEHHPNFQRRGRRIDPERRATRWAARCWGTTR